MSAQLEVHIYDNHITATVEGVGISGLLSVEEKFGDVENLHMLKVALLSWKTIDHRGEEL